MLTIRLLNKEHAKNYRDLRLESFLESSLAFSESYEDERLKSIADFEYEIRQEGTPLERFTLGAFNATEELMGFVTFRRDIRSKARHKSMVFAMYVSQAHRNKQIGHALMIDLIRRAKQLNGLEQIHLWVLHSDRSASTFYARLGFTNQGPYVAKDLKIGDTYVDAEYMVLYL